MDAEDETAITEITIQPDGRIYVFGLSLEVARVLAGLCPAGHAIGRLISTFDKPIEPDKTIEAQKPRVLTESAR